jgi:PmbA protein
VKELLGECVGLAARAVELARRAGADDAEALVRDGAALSVKVRMGDPELVSEAQSRALGLRVLHGGRAAATYTSDLGEAALARFVEETVGLARIAEPDDANALPDREELCAEVPELDLFDERLLGIDAGTALGWAKLGEDAAFAEGPHVHGSEGATFTRQAGVSAFATSRGFAAGWRATFATFHVAPVCEEEGGKKRAAIWWTAARFLEDLQPWEQVGREAGRRAEASIGARRVATCQVPVVFDPDAGRQLVAAFASLVDGAAWRKRASYLVGREGDRCASPLVTFVDDALVRRGPGSRPFDGDGLRSRATVVVEDGVLREVLCDVYSARKLGRRSTASASRGIGGASSPGTTNFLMRPGTTPASELVAGVERGFLCTDLMGFGFNPVTGSFSRGASGFWIENGERAFPVTGVTVAASFDELWQSVDAVGDTVDARAAIACPMFRVARMTVAGG